MAVTAYAGPLIVFGARGVGGAAEYNPSRGPSLFDQGNGFLDARTGYTPGNASTTAVKGWFGSVQTLGIDQVPSVASTVNIAAAQVPVANTPLTLVATTGAGITTGVSITNAATGATVTGLLAIDGPAGMVAFGTDATVQVYDPTKALSRCLIVTSVGNDSAGFYTIAGYDVYGYPMTQRVTGPNATTGTTLKAFKYIASVTPSGTLSGANVSIGTTDTYGFPIAMSNFAYAELWWGAAQPSNITTPTGFTPSVTTTPATSLTGDVRGTYTVQSASDGTKRFTAYFYPTAAMAASTVLVTGVTQA